MIHLRSFVHQRLLAAAEEILAEVEKTITLALDEADAHRPTWEPHSQRQKLDSVHQITATESPLNGDEVLQETLTKPSVKECVSTSEVPSQTSADTDSNNGNYLMGQTIFNLSKIKEEEEFWDDGQTQEYINPSPEGVKNELEAQVYHEMQPVSSDDSSAPSESSGSDEEWVQNKVRLAKKKRRKVRILRRQKRSSKRESPDGDSSAVNEKEPSVNCNVCGKTFAYRSSLLLHSKIHKGIKDFKCQFCGKTFVQKHHLIDHTKIHSGERPYRCDVCGKTFIQKQNLNIHRRTHTGERPYRCDTCGKTFSQKQNLKVHRRIHTGERPYCCSICGKTFIQRHGLIIHTRRHTEDRLYRCGLCGQQFPSAGNLKLHMKRQKPSSCDKCGKKFCQRGELIRHEHAHAAESVE